MVIDTSALVAYILKEPPAARLLAAIRRSPVVSLSAVGLVECTMVLVGKQGRSRVREAVRSSTT